MYVYADNAATTAMSQVAVDAMMPYMMTVYGNPSSLHSVGQEAKEALENARATVAQCLGCEPREIIFTSGGSEADNQAIRSAAYYGARKNKKHIITTAFEHHAVLHTLAKLEKEGFEVTYLDVRQGHTITAQQVKDAIREDTCLVTVMYANNEIGSILPIAEIGAVCKKHGVLFHTDAVQAVGHVPIDVQAMHIDLLSLSGHKFGGPKGVGALYMKKPLRLPALIQGGGQEKGHGGGQEQGVRSGTENLPYAVGLATAARRMEKTFDARAAHVAALNARLRAGLAGLDVVLNSPADAVSEVLNFSTMRVKSETMLHYLEQTKVYVSSGSACSRGAASHTLAAMGLEPRRIDTALRVSFCAENTEADVDALLNGLEQGLKTLAQLR